MSVKLTNIKQDERFGNLSLGTIILFIIFGILGLTYFTSGLMKIVSLIGSAVIAFVLGQVPYRISKMNFLKWRRAKILNTNIKTTKYNFSLTDLPNVAERLDESLWEEVEVSQETLDLLDKFMLAVEEQESTKNEDEDLADTEIQEESNLETT